MLAKLYITPICHSNEVSGGDGVMKKRGRKMETIDKFDEEGKIEIIKRERVRIECNICGKPAHFKHTFLLPYSRTNPASSGYGKDDISRCEDEHQFSCNEPECIKQCKKMNGYHWCSTYPATPGFKHLFLRWEEIKPPDVLPFPIPVEFKHLFLRWEEIKDKEK